MSFYLILIILFCVVGIPYGLRDYKKVKGKSFWTYAWSVHALVFAIIATLLRIFNLNINFIDLVAGSTLFVSGYGLLLLETMFVIENKKLMFTLKRSLIYSMYHAIMAFLGIWLVFTTQPNYLDILLAIMILLLYARLMIPEKLNVPWILYKKSSIPLKLKKMITTAFIIFLYILLPSLSLLI